MRPRKKDRHLPACVYLRSGTYYYVKAGKWRPLGRDLNAALTEYARIVAQPEGGMAKVIDDALADHKRNVKASTFRQYETAARKLKVILAEFRPDQVQARHVAQIKAALAGTPNMANRCLSVLKIVFAYAAENQLVDSIPTAGIKPLKEAKRKRYIHDDEYRKIHAKAGARLQVIMDLAYLTGQRITDVLSIRLSDLTETGIEFEQQKEGVRLCVVWTPELREAVARAKALQGPVRALTLLKNRRGKAPDYRTVRDQWEAACTAAGVEDAHLHDLRAKAITDAKRQGKDAQALAGHANPEMTDRYIRRREHLLVYGPSIGNLMDATG